MILALGDRDPAYLTHREVDAALALFPAGTDWVGTSSSTARDLDGCSGIWLLPGTPYRDADAALAAIRYCLVAGVPFLGTCGGFQHALVELARGRAGNRGCRARGDDTEAATLVVSRLACSLYGEVRTVTPVPGTRFAEICGVEPFEGYHYCGYGLDPGRRPLLQAGVVVGATAPDAGVEAIELPGHRFFLATAFQPQVGTSETGRLSPLLEAFVAAAALGAV